MFDNFITNRKDPDCFHVPDKRYVSDVRAISKMGVRGLQDLVSEQDKYISVLINNVSQDLYRFKTEKICTKGLSIRINSFNKNMKSSTDKLFA